jgi:hypothetical protein
MSRGYTGVPTGSLDLNLDIERTLLSDSRSGDVGAVLLGEAHWVMSLAIPNPRTVG